MKLTIIIPVYNMANSIQKTIQSLIHQSDKDFKVIIVDDGSTDDSIDIIKNVYETKDIDLSFYQKPNSGVSSARNMGLTNAKSDYVLFLDADDLLHKDFILSINPVAEMHFDLITFGYAKRSKNSRESKNHHIIQGDGLVDARNEIERYFALQKNRMKFHISSIIFRRDFLLKNQFFFDESLKSGEDSLFVFKAMMLSNSVYNINKTLFYYVQNEGSVTNSFNVRLLDSFKAFTVLSEFFSTQQFNTLSKLVDLKSSLLLQVQLYRLRQRSKDLSIREFFVEIVKIYPELGEKLMIKVKNSRTVRKGIYLNMLWFETYIFSLIFNHYFRRAKI